MDISTLISAIPDGRQRRVVQPTEPISTKVFRHIGCREVDQTPSYQQLETLHKSGDLAIFDFDGYDYKELGMTPEDTIRDLNHSWGHGLVLSLLLQGIDPRRLF